MLTHLCSCSLNLGGLTIFGLHKVSRLWPSGVCVGTIYMPRIAFEQPILVNLCDTLEGNLTSPKVQDQVRDINNLGISTETKLWMELKLRNSGRASTKMGQTADGGSTLIPKNRSLLSEDIPKGLQLCLLSCTALSSRPLLICQNW